MFARHGSGGNVAVYSACNILVVVWPVVVVVVVAVAVCLHREHAKGVECWLGVFGCAASQQLHPSRATVRGSEAQASQQTDERQLTQP
jgi:hypothetical protein